MKLLRILPITLLLLACDKEVERAYQPAHLEIRTISCSYSCFRCDIDFEGVLDCGIKSCLGTQQAQVSVTPYQVWYESGQTRHYEQVHVIKTLTSCN